MSVQPLRLYDYPASCNCYKVRLLLGHLGRCYERINVDIFDGETLTEEYFAMNPMRTTPVLEVAPGCYLPESNAILVYLARGSQYLPEEPFEFAQIMRWLIYEQTDVVPMIGGLRFRLLVGRLRPSEADALRRRAGALGVLTLLDDHLRACEFFVADRYTIADIAIFGYTHRATEAGLDLEPYAGVRAWIERVMQQPGFIEDVEPYGPNAAPGAGRSLYD
jgi:glutathione S-transferase